MFKRDDITKIEILKDLKEDQIQAIINLAQVAEDKIIGDKTKTIHSQYDADIFEITGIEKPANVHTYDNLKTILKDLVGKAAKSEKVEELEAQIVELKKGGKVDEAVIAENDRLKQALEDKKTEIETIKTTLGTEKTNLLSQLENERRESQEFILLAQMDRYLIDNGIELDDTIKKTIRDDTLDLRKKRILSSVVSDVMGDGSKTPVFRDKETNEILVNKATFKPYTIGELYVENIGDLIKEGKTQTGAGTKPAGKTDGTPVDLTGKTTKSAVLGAIDNYLISQGIAKTDGKFYEKRDEIKQTVADFDELPDR
jgi:hypothetical protein